jgi:hypothetical protein
MEETKQPSSHNFDTLQLVFTGLGVLGLWAMAFASLFIGIIGQIDVNSTPSSIYLLTLVCFFASFLLAGASLIPGVILPLLAIRGKILPSGIAKRGWVFWLLAGLWPLLLLLGNRLLAEESIRVFLFPIVHVVTVLIPFIVLLWVATGGIHFSSPQRAAGLTMTGMLGGTVLSLILEALVIVGLGILLIALLLLNPEWMVELTRLASRLSIAAEDAQAIQQIIMPYLSRPGVLAVVIALGSGFIPLIEELCKPIGFWLLFRREWTLKDGFIGGVFSGAGFGLIESLLATSQSLDVSWATIVTTRIGAAVMHIFCSGLVGMALVYGWKQKRYLKMIGLYLAAALIHGLWNFFAVMISFNQVDIPTTNAFLATLGSLSPFFLGLLGAGGIVGLILVSRTFRLMDDNPVRVTSGENGMD